MRHPDFRCYKYACFIAVLTDDIFWKALSHNAFWILYTICDGDIEKAKKLAKLTKAHCYDDFDQMLESEKMEVLYILLPPFAHNGQFEKAAKKGIHVFIEKPIALTSERGKSMVEAGEAGNPVLFNGRYNCNSLHTPWWIDVNLCGGQIFEQAIHVYDICRYFFGHPKAVATFMGFPAWELSDKWLHKPQE